MLHPSTFSQAHEIFGNDLEQPSLVAGQKNGVKRDANYQRRGISSGLCVGETSLKKGKLASKFR